MGKETLQLTNSEASDFVAWDAELGSNKQLELPAGPSATNTENAVNRIVDLSPSEFTVTDTEIDTLPTTSSEEAADKTSATSRVFNKISESAGNIADRFAEKGPAEMAKDSIIKIGRSALNIAGKVPTALKTAEEFQRNHIDGKVPELAAKVPELAAKGWTAAKENYNKRRAIRAEKSANKLAKKEQDEAFASYESNVAYSNTDQYEQATEMNQEVNQENAAFEANINAKLDARYNQSVEDAEDVAFDMNEAYDSNEAEIEKARAESRAKKEVAEKYKQARKEAHDKFMSDLSDWRRESWKNTKDRLGKTKIGRFGRALGRFVRGGYRAAKVTGSYVKGAVKSAHSNGMESARATKANFASTPSAEKSNSAE